MATNENCVWCRRIRTTQPITFPWREASLPLCAVCARLLAPSAYESDLHDDLDVRYLSQESLDQRLKEVFASGAGSSDRCWWCARPAAPVDCTVSLDGELLFEDPVLCAVCVGLSGHVTGGFARLDEEWERAREAALEVLERELVPVGPGLRERAIELVLAKLALLEIQATRYGLDYPGDGFYEFAHSVGLAEKEGRAQIMRLFDEPDSVVTFRRRDDTIVPVLSAVGRARLEALQREYRNGSPFATKALRASSLQRTLDRLEVETTTSA
ncbi:MAG: hypothetical protein ACJ757_14390 [Gaiellaceae bacterium]